MSWPPTKGGGGLGGPGSFAARTRQLDGGTVLLSDGVIRCDATTGSKALQLMPAADAFVNGVGAIFTFKKIDASANPVVVLGDVGDGDMIDGFPDVSLTSQYETIAIQSNGTGWDVLFRG